MSRVLCGDGQPEPRLDSRPFAPSGLDLVLVNSTLYSRGTGSDDLNFRSADQPGAVGKRYGVSRD